MITENGKCHAEIKKIIGMAIDAFKKLGQTFKDLKMLIDAKQECWTAV